MEASCKFTKCNVYILTSSLLIVRKWKYPNLESRLFAQHESTNRHQKQCRHVISKGQKPLQLFNTSDFTDDAIWTRIHCAWWLAKEDIAIRKFPSHLDAQLVNKGLEPLSTYKDERVAWDIVELIDKHFQKGLQCRIQKSPYFGIMADETTNKSVEQPLIVYIKFLDLIDGKLQSAVHFLGLVTPVNGSAENIKVL